MSADRDEDQLARRRPPAAPLTPAQKRTRALITVLLIGGLVGGLAWSTVKQTTPSGSTSSMGGMKMGSGMNMGTGDMVAISLRDVDGRRFDLPGRAPGAVLFMAAAGCPECGAIAARLAQAADDVRPRPELTLIGTDPVDTREDFRRFDRAAGRLPVRYALDDRGGSVAGQFGAGENGTVVVYRRNGMIVRRLPPGPRQARAFERALHRL